jgi:hypothetical protein
LLLCLAGFAGLAGCGGEQGSTDSAAQYEHVYTVRAQVTQVPDGSPGGQFLARHEAIPDYVAANGSVGMHAMVMPFTIVDPAVLEGIVVGDVVEITFGETHRPRVSQGVIAITKLPADTALDFGDTGE